MVRFVKILLVALVALWGLIGAAANFAHIGLAYDQVRIVTTMPMFPEGAGPPWATDNPLVVWTGVAIIVLGKIAAFIFCGLGALAMLRARLGDAEVFQKAKQWALVGGGLAIISLFGGFTVFAETLFVMFRNPEVAPAADAAFRYGGFIALIMIFVGQKD